MKVFTNWKILHYVEHVMLFNAEDAYGSTKKTTLEVNTPSHEQCVISHLERNGSRELLESIRNQYDSLSDIEIPPIGYLDPFDNRKEW